MLGCVHLPKRNAELGSSSSHSSPIPPFPCLWQSLMYFLSIWILRIFDINGRLHYLVFCVRLFAQYHVFKAHLFYSMYLSIVRFCGQIIVHCVNISHCIYQSISSCTCGLFHLGAIIQVFVWTSVFISLGNISRSGNLGCLNVS